MITVMSLSNEIDAVFNLLQYVYKLNSVIHKVIPFLALLWKKKNHTESITDHLVMRNLRLSKLRLPTYEMHRRSNTAIYPYAIDLVVNRAM